MFDFDPDCFGQNEVTSSGRWVLHQAKSGHIRYYKVQDLSPSIKSLLNPVAIINVTLHGEAWPHA